MSAAVRAGYKLTEMGVIPEDWKARKLSELASFRTGPFGSALHKSDYTNDGVPVVNPMHINDGCIEPTRTMTITESAAAGLSDFRLTAGEVLIGRRGDMGRCAVVRAEQNGWLCGTGSMIVRPSTSFDADFLQRILSSPPVISAIENSSVGSTMINLNQGTLGGLVIQTPPLPEQRAIATALSDVDALLAKLDALIAKKRDLKVATMQQLLTGQTRLPGFSGEWEVKRIDDIAIANWGNTFTTKSAYRDSGVQAYSASGPDGFVDWCEQQGVGVVISAIGAQCGKTWLTKEKWTPIKNTIWFRAIADRADTSFLYWVTSNPDFWPNRGQAQPFIALGDVRAALVCSPPLAEQSAIATVLSDMDAELTALEARRDKTRALKQGMMQELLTGRIRLI